MTYLTATEFKQQAKAKALNDPRVRKDYPASVTDTGDRTLRFTISTADADRSHDVIDQSGWLLSNYQANPVVLAFHNSNALPVGKCIDIAVEDGALKATVQFVPADMPVAGELAEACYRMCLDGFLNATSVGFIPVAWEWSDDEGRPDGVDYQVSELLEFSIVPVPSNPYALIERPIEVASEHDTDKHAPLLNTPSNDARTRRRNIVRLLALRK